MSPASSSDSDSPKSSSSSSNRSEEEGEEGNPKSMHQSSDESTTSDGVLVDLPGNADGGGILVNIDGREDLFVDASEELGSARSVRGLDESVAIVGYGESSRSDRLEEAMEQCQKYKEEREIFGREISSIRQQLQEIFHRRLSPSTSNKESIELLHQMERGREDEAFISPTPLHTMVNDCSKMLSHLNSILNGQPNAEDTIKGLNAVIYTKEQEAEDLNLKLAGSNVCQDVVISYMGSVREVWSRSLKESSDELSNRLLSSLETVIEHEGFSSEDSIGDRILIVEKKILSLIGKHAQLLSETQQIRQFLAETSPELKSSEENDPGFIYSIVHEQLLESRRQEASFLEKISELEDENRRMTEEINKMKEGLEMVNAETNKTKTELEQAENKLAAAREKLSIAVTKGKSLVQHRDTLKQSLAEKTSELEKFAHELQQKSNALETSEARGEELKQLLAEKTNELENCLLELQQKSTALETTETGALEMNHSLGEKTSELEKCLLVLQQKSEALENIEATAEALKQSLAEKAGELDACVLELRQKSDALATSETNYEELKQLLAEKNGKLEKCLLELQQKSDALEATEVSAEEQRQMFAQKTIEFENCLQELQMLRSLENIVEDLKLSLAEKTSELEKCQLEFQEKSDTLQNSITTGEDLKVTQTLVNSLSERDRVLKEIEEAMQHADLENAMLATEVVDRVKWFVSLKHKLDAVMSESKKVKDTLSAIDFPETVSSTDLCSQIEWLVKSYAQAMEDVIKTKEESAGVRIAMASHESELSEAHKEMDQLATSLLEVKQEKDFLHGSLDDLKCKYEKIAEKLSLVCLENDGPAKELVVASARALDGQPHLDADILIERCITAISKRMKSYLTLREQFEEMQRWLYVTDLELMLCKNMLEEETISVSEVRILSNKLRKASQEVVSLKTEKDALQKELDRVEEKSALIREKLSMAVKKGKGLVQEREGFKQSLDEKSSEIKKLKEELQLQESAIVEYKKQIESLSAYPEQIQKLDFDIASLKDLRAQSESLLLESNGMLQELVKTIEDIVLPSDESFEKPVEKLYWMAEYISESEVAKAHKEQELEEVKSEAALHSSMSADAFATIETLKDELSKAEKHMYDIIREKKDMQQEKEDLQLVKENVEQELEKLKEVSIMQASKLEDAYASKRTLEDQLGKMNFEQELEKLRDKSSVQASQLEDAFINMKSLEDTLARSYNNISKLEAEKEEIESKSQQQIDALKARLTDCMEELEGIRSSFEDQSGELAGHIEDLQMLMKDDTLFSLMTEEFRKKTDSLRNTCILIEDLHNHFTAKGLNIHTGFEVSDFAKFSSLQNFEDFVNNGKFNGKISMEFGDATTLSKIVEGLHCQAKLLGNWFQGLSSYVDDHIAVISQNLQTARDEFIHMLELSESLRLAISKLETQNQACEVEISSLKKETVGLLSACQDAIRELQIDCRDFLEFYPEESMTGSSLGSINTEAVEGMLEEGDSGKYNKGVESLLLASRRIRTQAEQLININKVLVTSVSDLKDKLLQANLTAETAIQDRQLSQERLLKLEGDLEELQNICSEMRVKIEDNQAKEAKLRSQVAEPSSLQDALAVKERGIGEWLFAEGQLETLSVKVNEMKIPLNESKSHMLEVHFSNPVDKLFYILDNFTELQQRLDSMTCEKKDMQSILEAHVSEIERHKKTAESVGTNYQDLESKKLDLVELTVGVEKLIQRFGQNNANLKGPSSVKGLLPVLEGIMVTLNSELEISKSSMQELGHKIQATENVIDELSTKNKLLEDSMRARLAQQDIVKEKAVFDTSSTAMVSEISEIEDAVQSTSGALGKSSPAAHVRTMRKGSNDHLILNIESDSDRLISAEEIDDKGHVFKSLNTTGLIPKQGKLIADRVDGFWVSGGRILMNRPRARLGLIAYWIFLHLWLLGTIW